MRKLVIAFVILSAAAMVRAEGATDLEGCWIGFTVIDRESTSLRLQLTTENEVTTARLDVPEMRAAGVGLGPVKRDGPHVSMGPFRFELTEEGRLQGDLQLLDPVDQPRVVFRRSRWRNDDCSSIARAPDLEVLWETNAGAGIWASPVHDLRTGSILIGTLEGRLIALASDSGKIRWSRLLGGSIRSTPVVSDRKVIVASDDGRLTAVDVSDGSIVWQREIATRLDTPHPPMPGPEFHYRGHQVRSSAGGLFIGTLEGMLIRVDPADGATIESAELGSAVTAIAERAGGGIVVSTIDGRARSFTRDLSEQWSFQARGAVYGELLDDGSRVYLGDRAYYLYAVDSSSGDLVWKRKLWFSWFDSGATIHDGLLYVGSSDSQAVRALDPATGAELWSAEVGGWAWPTPVLFDGLVVQGVAAVAKYTSRLEPGLALIDPVTGQVLRKTVAQLGDDGVYGIVVTPLVVEDILYTVDARGSVRAMHVN